MMARTRIAGVGDGVHGEAVLRVASVFFAIGDKGRNPRPSEAVSTRLERFDERLERSAANRSG
jgi:hypothetical protein